MRKIAVLAVVFAVGLSSVAFAGTLMDKEAKLIASTQTRFERTNNLRDMRPNQLAIQVGPPLFLGAVYSYNINEMFAVQAGAGYIAPGISAELGILAYILPTTIAPYARGGVVYYANLSENAVAFTVGAGVDVALDNALGLQLGVDWVKSISNAGAPFQSISAGGDINWFNISGGVSVRF